jgi:O-antigen/teichoic acid export membrane protein
MNKFAINIFVNFAGNVWTAIMYIVFIPVYIHILGIEAFGLIGFYASLQAIFSVFDIGLGATLNRELAKLSVSPNKEEEMRDMVRTLEVLYWILGFCIGLTICILSPFIANYWLQSRQISTATIQQAIVLIGITIAAQWPFTLYSGGLMGLQRQVLLNIIIIITVSLRFAGVIPILWYVSPSIKTYFLWQVIIGIGQTLLVTFCLWHSLPSTKNRAKFQIDYLRQIWRFAAGISGITFFGIILLQMDKIILSKLLTLEIFGYYSLASTVAFGLYRLIAPVFNAAYPQFTQLVSLGDIKELKILYHRTCQIMAVLVIPPALIIAGFSPQILLLWTRDPQTVEYAHLILSLLITGTALNGLVNPPYALQLAYGWTKLTVYSNIIAVVVLGPLLIISTLYYGPVGAALSWLFLNIGYILIYVQIMHTRLLKTDKRKWYIQDVAYPLLSSLITIILGKIVFYDYRINLWFILILLIIYVFSLIITIFSSSELRNYLIGLVKHIVKRNKFNHIHIAALF